MDVDMVFQMCQPPVQGNPKEDDNQIHDRNQVRDQSYPQDQLELSTSSLIN